MATVEEEELSACATRASGTAAARGSTGAAVGLFPATASGDGHLAYLIVAFADRDWVPALRRSRTRTSGGRPNFTTSRSLSKETVVKRAPRTPLPELYTSVAERWRLIGYSVRRTS